ncbi:alpha/beta hydrolase [Bacillus infantis]|uniref:alpha/beta fold hydrolase n=1 Tax=Bacillus infantis TaxID=324767 RepID=UPI001CD7209E|nr:alpha/beta hydrolase [Bacillus infantis]MCA1038532.1 alpha/beta hydrolase [Bacillus infantis]
MESALVTLRNESVFVKQMGEGEPIVFLHGGPGSEHRFFLPHLEPLASQFQLVFYDQRGCGESSFSVEAVYTMDEEVETLEALRQHLEIGRLNLVGESWGSMLALLYASKYPANVSRLFLTAAVGAKTEGYENFGRLLMERLSEEELERFHQITEDYKEGKAAAADIFKVIDPYYLYDSDNLAKKTATISNSIVNSQIGEDILQNYESRISPAALADIPVMAAQGEGDILTPDMLEELLLPLIPHAAIEVIPKCGHWTAIEQPAILMEKIIDYFSKEKRND